MSSADQPPQSDPTKLPTSLTDFECTIIQVFGTRFDGRYELMETGCNDHPAWVKLGLEEAYIQFALQGWSLSSSYCQDGYMYTCHVFYHDTAWNCDNHPLNTDGESDHTLGMPWEEKFWVNNWWDTVQMSCAEWTKITTAVPSVSPSFDPTIQLVYEPFVSPSFDPTVQLIYNSRLSTNSSEYVMSSVASQTGQVWMFLCSLLFGILGAAGCWLMRGRLSKEANEQKVHHNEKPVLTQNNVDQCEEVPPPPPLPMLYNVDPMLNYYPMQEQLPLQVSPGFEPQPPLPMLYNVDPMINYYPMQEQLPLPVGSGMEPVPRKKQRHHHHHHHHHGKGKKRRHHHGHRHHRHHGKHHPSRSASRDHPARRKSKKREESQSWQSEKEVGSPPVASLEDLVNAGILPSLENGHSSPLPCHIGATSKAVCSPSRKHLVRARSDSVMKERKQRKGSHKKVKFTRGPEKLTLQVTSPEPLRSKSNSSIDERLSCSSDTSFSVSRDLPKVEDEKAGGFIRQNPFGTPVKKIKQRKHGKKSKKHTKSKKNQQLLSTGKDSLILSSYFAEKGKRPSTIRNVRNAVDTVNKQDEKSMGSLRAMKELEAELQLQLVNRTSTKDLVQQLNLYE